MYMALTDLRVGNNRGDMQMKKVKMDGIRADDYPVPDSSLFTLQRAVCTEWQ